MNERLRQLPGVDRVLASLEGSAAPRILSRAARQAVEEARARILEGSPAPSIDEVVAAARSILAADERTVLQPVINATGVVIHTNLGRVPLGDRQIDAIYSVASGYSNLEYEIDEGRRGSRYSHATRLITAVTGAQSAVVVNNNAAAVLLVLRALCARREVIVSRGELIEIGGEFRLPEVMGTSGARLVEVGTTNRTHLADYERAIGPDTAAILKVHTSNYAVVGFTSSVGAHDLVRLARGRGVLFVFDVGSGLLDAPPGGMPLRREPTVVDAIKSGADLVTFSGDKLLGGPQAGVIAGRADLIATIARDPLMRALRVDKMTLAALEATLDAYIEGQSSALPVWQMLAADTEDLRTRAVSLAERIRTAIGDAVKAEPVRTSAVSGGGSAPNEEIDSWAVALHHPELGAAGLAAALRRGKPPVVARVEEERVLLDARTVPPDQDGPLLTAVVAALPR